MDVGILLKGDQCHRCLSFERPDPYSEGITTDFPLEQSVISDPIRKVTCVTCGGDEFLIGRADYSIFIKCKKCDWEHRIHLC